jgi:predicted metal-dependent hydrolase
MLLDWTTGPLAEGLRCYQKQEFFDAHEHWEAVWLKCDEPVKTFLQALIQVTAAFHHFKRGNLAGTASLLQRSLLRLDDFPAEYEEVAVEQLRASIRVWLEALRLEDALLQLPLPLIR